MRRLCDPYAKYRGPFRQPYRPCEVTPVRCQTLTPDIFLQHPDADVTITPRAPCPNQPPKDPCSCA